MMDELKKKRQLRDKQLRALLNEPTTPKSVLIYVAIAAFFAFSVYREGHIWGWW